MEHDITAVATDMLHQFGLGNSSLEPLEDGSQTHFRVLRGTESFLLKIVDEEYSASRVRSQIEFMDYLRDAGLPIVETIRTINEEPFAISAYGKSIGILTRWIDGQPVSELPVREFAGRSGELLARFHEVSAAFEPSSDFETRAWDEMYAAGESEWLRSFIETSNMNDDSKETVLAATETLKSIFKNVPRDSRHYGILHADFHADNLIFDGEQIRIIDLEDIGWGHFPFDLTWPEALYAKYHGSQEEFWGPFLDGYRAVRPFEFDEPERAMYRLGTGIGLLDMIHTSPVDNAGEKAREWSEFAVGWMKQQLDVLASNASDETFGSD